MTDSIGEKPPSAFSPHFALGRPFGAFCPDSSGEPPLQSDHETPHLPTAALMPSSASETINLTPRGRRRCSACCPGLLAR
jgi:hypothetical protein